MNLVALMAGNLRELLRLYKWRKEVGNNISKGEALQYGKEKKQAWIDAEQLLKEYDEFTDRLIDRSCGCSCHRTTSHILATE